MTVCMLAIAVIALSVAYLRALWKIEDLKFLLVGAIRFGPERFTEMLKNGPPGQRVGRCGHCGSTDPKGFCSICVGDPLTDSERSEP